MILPEEFPFNIPMETFHYMTTSYKNIKDIIKALQCSNFLKSTNTYRVTCGVKLVLNMNMVLGPK